MGDAQFDSSENKKLLTFWISIEGEQGNLNPILLYRIQENYKP